MSRSKDEKSIKRLDPKNGDLFEDALTALAFRHGFKWFTDEQIAEIRAEIIKAEWKRRGRMVESRAHYAAMQEAD